MAGISDDDIDLEDSDDDDLEAPSFLFLLKKQGRKLLIIFLLILHVSYS